MISFKCKNCGGEMSVDSSGSLVCEYCGSNSFFADSELTGYRDRKRIKYLKERKRLPWKPLIRSS